MRTVDVGNSGHGRHGGALGRGALGCDRYAELVQVKTHEQAIAARVRTIFGDVDAVVTPGTASGPLGTSCVADVFTRAAATPRRGG